MKEPTTTTLPLRRVAAVKPSEIVFHGRSFPSGLAVFTCYERGLGQFRTDESDNVQAARDALQHFNEAAQKGAA